MDMMLIFIGIIFAFIIASYGGQRKIGFTVALLVSLSLSPLIGFMCVVLSERKNKDDDQNNSSNQNTNNGFDIEQFRRN